MKLLMVVTLEPNQSAELKNFGENSSQDVHLASKDSQVNKQRVENCHKKYAC